MGNYHEEKPKNQEKTAKKCKTNVTESQKQITDTKVSKYRQNDTKWPKWNQKPKEIEKKKCKKAKEKSKNGTKMARYVICCMPSETSRPDNEPKQPYTGH